MKKNQIVCFSLILFLILPINFDIVVGYTNISPAEAKEALETENIFLLDVRTSYEYLEGHILGAYLVPVGELDDRKSELPANFSHSLIVYCQTGSRSMIASEKLDSYGYSDVRNLAGGINAWIAANYEIEIGEPPTETTTTQITENGTLTTETETTQITETGTPSTSTLRLSYWVLVGSLFPALIYLFKKRKK